MGGAHLSQRKGGQPRPTHHSGKRSDRTYKMYEAAQSKIEALTQQLIARDAELCICRDELSRHKVALDTSQVALHHAVNRLELQSTARHTELRLCQQDCTDLARTSAAQKAANMLLVDVVNQLQLDLEWARGVHHR